MPQLRYTWGQSSILNDLPVEIHYGGLRLHTLLFESQVGKGKKESGWRAGRLGAL